MRSDGAGGSPTLTTDTAATGTGRDIWENLAALVRWAAQIFIIFQVSTTTITRARSNSSIGSSAGPAPKSMYFRAYEELWDLPQHN